MGKRSWRPQSRLPQETDTPPAPVHAHAHAAAQDKVRAMDIVVQQVSEASPLSDADLTVSNVTSLGSALGVDCRRLFEVLAVLPSFEAML